MCKLPMVVLPSSSGVLLTQISKLTQLGARFVIEPTEDSDVGSYSFTKLPP